MKKSVLSLSFAAGILLFGGCSKDDDSSPGTTSDYAHLTAGSNWTYKFTEGSTPAETFKLTVTNKDTVVNQKTYKVLTSTDGANSYIGKMDNNYYRLASFPSLGINTLEELYLKSNEAVNATWTNQTNVVYAGQTISANLTYTIKAKGESRTVLTNAYTNVIRVRLDIAAFGSTLGGGDFYYAEGVGLIESNILVTPPFAQPYTAKQELISSDLK